MGTHAIRKDPIWATSGHGGTAERPNEPPPLPDDVAEAKAQLRLAEAEYFAKQTQLREAIARRERRR